jgi:hypothetical protein
MPVAGAGALEETNGARAAARPALPASTGSVVAGAQEKLDGTSAAASPALPA